MGHTGIWSSGLSVACSVVSHKSAIANQRDPGVAWNGQPLCIPVPRPEASEAWLREIGHNQSMAVWVCALDIHSCKILDKAHRPVNLGASCLQTPEYSKAMAPGSTTFILLNSPSISSIIVASLAGFYGPHDDFYPAWLGRSQGLAQQPVP
jgi:hypothetical protein